MALNNYYLGFAGFTCLTIIICLILCRINRGKRVCSLQQPSQDSLRDPQLHNTQQSPQQQTHNQQWQLRPGDVYIRGLEELTVNPITHITSQRQREPRYLPHSTTHNSPARHNVPTRYENVVRVSTLPKHEHGMQLPNLQCMPTCAVCQERKCDCCLDCGHLFCNACAEEVQKLDSLCPICRIKYADIRRIYPGNSSPSNRTSSCQLQKPTCDTGICRGLDCDCCLSCGHMLCYVCACQLEEMGKKCHMCRRPFTDIRRIYF